MRFRPLGRRRHIGWAIVATVIAFAVPVWHSGIGAVATVAYLIAVGLLIGLIVGLRRLMAARGPVRIVQRTWPPGPAYRSSEWSGGRAMGANPLLECAGQGSAAPPDCAGRNGHNGWSATRGVGGLAGTSRASHRLGRAGHGSLGPAPGATTRWARARSSWAVRRLGRCSGCPAHRLRADLINKNGDGGSCWMRCGSSLGTFTVDFVQDLVGGLGPDEWVAAVVPAGDEGRILAIRSGTEGKTPRRMAWRSMMPNQTSTRFSHGDSGGNPLEPWRLLLDF